jgi:hypothetical protein
VDSIFNFFYGYKIVRGDGGMDADASLRLPFKPIA